MEQRKQLYAFLNTMVNRRYINSGNPLLSCGYANGYVAVPPEHPMYGKGYDEVNVSIHGGLTFSEKKSNINNPEWWENVEKLGFTEDVPEDYWVFGFDTCHYEDGPHLDRDWCIEETNDLKQQLEVML